jgi:hypothetical protein
MPSQVLYTHSLDGTRYQVESEAGRQYTAYLFNSQQEDNYSVLVLVRANTLVVAHWSIFRNQHRTEEERLEFITGTVDIIDRRFDVNPVDPEEPTVAPPVVEEPYAGPRPTRYEKILSELPGSPEDILASMGLRL